MSKASFLVLSHGIFITISFTLLRRIAHLDNLKIYLYIKLSNAAGTTKR